MSPEERELIARMADQIEGLGRAMRNLSDGIVSANRSFTEMNDQIKKREGVWPPYDH